MPPCHWNVYFLLRWRYITQYDDKNFKCYTITEIAETPCHWFHILALIRWRLSWFGKHEVTAFTTALFITPINPFVFIIKKAWIQYRTWQLLHDNSSYILCYFCLFGSLINCCKMSIFYFDCIEIMHCAGYSCISESYYNTDISKIYNGKMLC